MNDLPSFQDALLQWFAREARALPWRNNYVPYEVWVSEIMLQQTQVVTMLPYFERFLRRFPTLQSLAAANEDEVLKLWEGLGYYSRARNLLKTARKIVHEHGGVFPAEWPTLRSLPGIGEYTAGAIASIAFEQNHPVLDGNVIRVLSRLDDFSEDVSLNKTYFWDRARSILPHGRARDFNQALMEFGALVCTPKQPSCARCPLQTHCKAFARNTVALRPVKSQKNKAVKIRTVVAILEHRGEIFVQKRREAGLMAGLWEFPGGKVDLSDASDLDALSRELREELDFVWPSTCVPKFFLALKHAYTKFSVDLQVYRIVLSDTLPRPNFRLNAATQSQWLPLSALSQLAFPSANKKILEKLCKK